ncbi:MAG: hypothetical protein ACYTGL_24885 [Planctomycetota bacterium]|jgi:uncharacterized coiled-coil protein SlyX
MSTPDGPNTTTPDADAELLDLLAAELNSPEPQEDVCGPRVVELERRLAERNQLVEILTERLEQAADQIDRLQRTGGALKSDAPAGLPLEFINEHRELAQRLEQFHGAWEERYEGPSLRRVERSLAELTDRFDQLRSLNLDEPPAAAAPAITSLLNQTEDNDEEESGDSASLDTSAADEGRIAPPASSSGGTSRIEIVLLSPTDENLPDDVPLPSAIDVKRATSGDLQGAVLQRDHYVSWLCQKVRTIASRLESWMREFEAQHDGTPSSQQFKELRQLIHSQIQVLEVELSIERAKLFREESRLEQEHERLTRERELLQKERAATGSSGNDTALVKRWKRFIQPE